MRIRHDPVSTPMQQAAGRVLLTGATGYVGGRLLRKLEESGTTRALHGAETRGAVGTDG